MDEADPLDRVMRQVNSFFPRMRSKGSRFTLGVWGLRVCSLDIAFTSATVRNRPCEARMAVPIGSSAKVVAFGGFRRRVASFRVAGIVLWANMFHNMSKVVLFGKHTSFASFPEGELQFWWRAQHFGGHPHFAWQADVSDASCCVFSANHITA